VGIAAFVKKRASPVVRLWMVAIGGGVLSFSPFGFCQPTLSAFEVTSVKPTPIGIPVFKAGQPLPGRHELHCSPDGRFVSIGEGLMAPILGPMTSEVFK
jgi:hypothetical protein